MKRRIKELHRFLSHRQNVFGLLIIAVFVFAALAAPILAPQPDASEFSAYREVNKLKGLKPAPPGPDAILGTVATGILGIQLDVFYTLVWGARSALVFGLITTLITALFGVFIGAVSGFIGGWVNIVLMRITDAFLAFPIVVGVVVFNQLMSMVVRFSFIESYILGKTALTETPLEALLAGIDPLMLALILFSWMSYARLTNTMVLAERQADYVHAAYSIGAKPLRIITRHLLPNVVSPSIVLAARDIGGMVLTQATFTFIGLGGGSYWGELLSIGRRWVIGAGGNPLAYWWVFVPVTLALVLFGMGWNLLGDGLNDHLSPRRK